MGGRFRNTGKRRRQDRAREGKRDGGIKPRVRETERPRKRRSKRKEKGRERKRENDMGKSKAYSNRLITGETKTDS